MSSALLLVDVQRNMLQPPDPVPDAAEVARRIDNVLARARDAGAVVVHVRNNGGPDDPDAPGTSGWELATEVRFGEHLVDKRESSGSSRRPAYRSSTAMTSASRESSHAARRRSMPAPCWLAPHELCA